MGYRWYENCPDPFTLRDFSRFPVRSLLLAEGRSQRCSQPTRSPASDHLDQKIISSALSEHYFPQKNPQASETLPMPTKKHFCHSFFLLSLRANTKWSVTPRTKIQVQVLIHSLLFWSSFRPLALPACIYCGRVNRAENSAYGSDLNCVISTWQGAGLHLDSSHIPHKFLKQIKSCAGRGGDPNFPCSPSLVWRAGFFPPQCGTQSVRKSVHTAHVSGRLWQCTSSSRPLLWT